MSLASITLTSSLYLVNIKQSLSALADNTLLSSPNNFVIGEAEAGCNGCRRKQRRQEREEASREREISTVATKLAVGGPIPLGKENLY